MVKNGATCLLGPVGGCAPIPACGPLVVFDGDEACAVSEVESDLARLVDTSASAPPSEATVFEMSRGPLVNSDAFADLRVAVSGSVARGPGENACDDVRASKCWLQLAPDSIPAAGAVAASAVPAAADSEPNAPANEMEEACMWKMSIQCLQQYRGSKSGVEEQTYRTWSRNMGG